MTRTLTFLIILVFSIGLARAIDLPVPPPGFHWKEVPEIKSDATGSVTIHQLMVANPKTNTLYLFIFESPTQEWAAAWRLGEKMINMLGIDDEI